MTDLPVCERCRRRMPCILIATVLGERTICVAECHPIWIQMSNDLNRTISDMVKEHHEDFFDVPTRNDLPPVAFG